MDKRPKLGILLIMTKKKIQGMKKETSSNAKGKAKVKKEKPVILITNDDGVTAPGILNLVEAVKDLGKIVVVARINRSLVWDMPLPSISRSGCINCKV